MATEKQQKMPPIVWLKITDYMHAWLQYELGGSLRIKDQRVVSVQHLDGARDILKMESEEDAVGKAQACNSMSATLRNLIDTGLGIDDDAIIKMYDVTADQIRLFVPIECPKNCVNCEGVVRPWTLTVNFSRRQARAMQELLRAEFWKAVGNFADEYARKHAGERYAQADMLEEFCMMTKTPDMYIEAMRREWQRRARKPAVSTEDHCQ